MIRKVFSILLLLSITIIGGVYIYIGPNQVPYFNKNYEGDKRVRKVISKEADKVVNKLNKVNNSTNRMRKTRRNVTDVNRYEEKILETNFKGKKLKVLYDRIDDNGKGIFIRIIKKHLGKDGVKKFIKSYLATIKGSKNESQRKVELLGYLSNYEIYGNQYEKWRMSTLRHLFSILQDKARDIKDMSQLKKDEIVSNLIFIQLGLRNIALKTEHKSISNQAKETLLKESINIDRANKFLNKLIHSTWGKAINSKKIVSLYNRLTKDRKVMFNIIFNKDLGKKLSKGLPIDGRLRSEFHKYIR